MGEDRNEAGSDSSAASNESRPDAVEIWKRDFSLPLKELICIENAVVNSFTGLFLTLRNDVFVHWRVAGNLAKKYTDITVKIDDIARDFTLEEFKERLGF